MSLPPTTLNTPCIEWAGSRGGYGRRQINGRRLLVHRWAWEQRHGLIPRGLFVCHRCDNPPCYNVDHLFLGTAADNAADKVAKGRHRNGGGARPGERHHRARLTDAQVAEIRQLHVMGAPQYLLADLFGVGRPQINKIVHFKQRTPAA